MSSHIPLNSSLSSEALFTEFVHTAHYTVNTDVRVMGNKIEETSS